MVDLFPVVGHKLKKWSQCGKIISAGAFFIFVHLSFRKMMPFQFLFLSKSIVLNSSLIFRKNASS